MPWVCLGISFFEFPYVCLKFLFVHRCFSNFSCPVFVNVFLLLSFYYGAKVLFLLSVNW